MGASLPERLRRLLGGRAAPWLALAVVALLSAPALGVGWLHDDLIQRQMLVGDDPALRRQDHDLYCFSGGPAAAPAPASDPWWRSARMTTCFLRPLSSLSIALDHRLFPQRPALAHLQGLLWFLLLLLGIRRLAAALFDERTAALALLIYGVAGFSGTPVAWIAARHTIISAALSTWGLVAYLRGRERRRPLWIALGAAGLALALLGGEGALAGLGFVAAYELCGARDAPRRRLLRAGASALGGGAYLSLYGRARYGAAFSGAYLDPLRHPGDFLLALPGRLLCLAGEAVLGVPSALYSFTPHKAALAALGALAVALVLGALRQGTAEARARRAGRLAFLGLGALLGAVPAAAAAMGGRVLMAPGVGLAILFAAALLPEEAPGEARAARLPRLAAAGLALGVLLLSPLSRLGQTRVLAHTTESEAALREVRQLGGCAESSHYLLIGSNEFTVAMYGPYVLPGLAPPRTWHQLTAAQGDVELERVDGRTLRLRGQRPLLGGFLYALFRAPGEALGPGSRGELRLGPGAAGAIEVEALQGGEPTALRVELPAALEDRRYCWLRYDGRLLQPLTLPPAGARTVVPYVRGPMSY